MAKTKKATLKKKSIIEAIPDQKPESSHSHSHDLDDKVHMAIHGSIDVLMSAISSINTKYSKVLSTEDVMFCTYMVGCLIAVQASKSPEEIVELFDEALLQAIDMGKEHSHDEDLEIDPNDEDAPRIAPKPKTIPNVKK